MILRNNISFLLLFVFLLTIGCSSNEKTDWKRQFSATSKAPFGFQLFKESVPAIFAGATVENRSLSASVLPPEDDSAQTISIYLASTLEFSLEDLQEISYQLEDGNDIVLIAESYGDELGNFLRLNNPSSWTMDENLTMNDALLADSGSISTKLFSNSAFGKENAPFLVSNYKQNPFIMGFKFETKATSDTSFFIQKHQVISQVENGLANAVVLPVGQGRLILCSTPLVFSNYVLLQNNNFSYLNNFFSHASPNTKRVYLSIGEYRESSGSDWGVIWKNKSTRTALLLSLAGILIYVLVNIRRKQNIIPVIKPLNNDTHSFIETIASLYFNNRNNDNIAQKMVLHFLEQIRNTYSISTNKMDAEFITKLSGRSGISFDACQYTVSQIKSVQENSVLVDDKYLYSLYKNLQQFFKKS